MNTRLASIILISLVVLSLAVLAEDDKTSKDGMSKEKSMTEKASEKKTDESSSETKTEASKAKDADKLTGHARALASGKGKKVGLKLQEPKKIGSEAAKKDYNLKSRERRDKSKATSTGKKAYISTLGS